MTIPLRQSTASQEVPLGYFLDKTDGDTEETGLTISNTDIKLWKMGATTLANKNAGGATHISNGLYYCVLDATDSNTLGSLIIFVHEAGALPVRVECTVYPAHVYDSLIAGTDKLEVDVVQLNSVAQSLIDLKDFADAGYDPATNKITGCKASDDMVGTNGANTTVPDAAGTLASYDPPTRAEATADKNAIIADLLTMKKKAAGTWNRETDSLEALRDRGDAAWTTGAGGSSPTVIEIREEIDLNSTQLDAIVTDTNELQGDWKNTGRLDNLLDAIPTTAMRGTDGANTTTPPTVGAIRTEMEGAGSKLLAIETDVTAIDVLTEGGGAGDLAAVKTQVDAVLDLERDGGVVTVTNVETTLFVDATPGKNKNGVVVKIDMAALVSGDTFVVKEKYKDESGGAYQTVDEVPYSGAQSDPLRIVHLTPYRYGAIITMQRTAGANRSIEWESFVEA